MRIRKYDFDFSRRAFLEKAATGAGAGILAPLWPTIAHSADNISKAYPDELLSIEMYTKGKIKTGDAITPNNVDLVKALLDETAYDQIKNQGRVIKIAPTVTDVTTLFNQEYLEATLRNSGRAKMGPDGNVWTDGEVGKPWIGGLPFPDSKNGNETAANITLAWGKHDYSQFAFKAYSTNPAGEQVYNHEAVWCELNTTARANGEAFRGMSDKLRLQSVFFTAPNDAKGSSFLNIWYYDQRKFPDLYGYFPAFKRVRQFPTNQRFEPLVPGFTFTLSDAWAAGDPMLTWGNYKIVSRGPQLAAVGGMNWNGMNPNWEKPFNGGKKGKTFMETYYSLVPEAIAFEAEPTGFPRAPVGNKTVWVDARNGHLTNMIVRDRRKAVWKKLELATGPLKNGSAVFNDAKGRPEWSWHMVHVQDMLENRMTMLHHVKQAGAIKTKFAENGEDVYNKYLTTSAMARLGQ